MAVLKSDELSLLVGDGEISETFHGLRGMTVTRFELSQQLADSTAVGEDAWAVAVATNARRAIIECEALATDEDAAVRIRTLAIQGQVGNFFLESSAAETLAFEAFVTQYAERIQAGAIKRFSCRLETSGELIFA